MFVVSMCVVERQQFGINFMPDGQGGWSAIGAVRVSPERSIKGYQPGKMTGGISLGPDFACPYCRNGSFYLCNACGGLNCMGGAVAHGEGLWVWCGWCPSQGAVGGTITDLTGFSDLG